VGARGPLLLQDFFLHEKLAQFNRERIPERIVHAKGTGACLAHMTDLIERFYSAFQNLDAKGMAECYHDRIVFEDPAFGILHGERARNMWRMLCASAKDLNIEYSDVSVEKNAGTANWTADYTFRRTGRKVHNVISAEFVFEDGKIIRHTDLFDLHSWAKQALGAKGFLIGGTSFFRKKLQQQTNRLLMDFESKNISPQVL